MTGPAIPIIVAILICSVLVIIRIWPQIKKVRSYYTAKAASTVLSPTPTPVVPAKKATSGFWKFLGWMVIIILTIFLIAKVFKCEEEKRALQQPPPRPTQVQAAQSLAPPPPPTPQWEIVAIMDVSYKWTTEDQGWVYVIRDMILQAGRYRMRFETGSQPFRQKTVWPNGEVEWLDIPPEGLRFRDTGACRGREYVDILAESPVPSECLDSRVMQVNNQKPIYVGRSLEFGLDIDSPIDIKVTIDTKRGPGYFHNEGGDKIIFERLAYE
jgi:hypothetical protein